MLAGILTILAVPAMLCAICLDIKHGIFSNDSAGWWALADFLVGTSDVLWHIWWLAAVFYFFGVLFLITWWRHRKRKRALQALGNKAKAILAAMKAKLRDAAKPRPVRIPQPEGAS